MTGLHPSFDALSACADQSDLHAARSRVGRHVARCPACSATMAEIRAMGDAVRAMEVPGAPAGLWASIERAQKGEAGRVPAPARSFERELPLSSGGERTNAPAPFRARRTVRRGGILLATAAVVMVAMLLPSPFHPALQAGPEQGRWQFSPANPAPGTTVRVRFEPAAGFPSADRVLLVGQPMPRWTDAVRASRSNEGLMDSVATLVRGADGAYSGSFVTPADFTGVALLLMPAGGGFFPVPRDTVSVAHAVFPYGNQPAALLVAAGPGGKPRLDALAGAAAVGGAWGTPGTGGYSLADTLIRYYPSEPIGYAVDRHVGGKRVIDDLIAYFKRGERQYLKFEERLMAQPAVSADREIAMAMFGQRISEPTESRRWVMRLVREHPEDPRSLRMYAAMLTDMFNEPGTLPLIRRGLALADTLWERNGHHESSGEMASIAARAGDTAAVARWAARNWTSGPVPYAFFPDYFDVSLLRDPALRPAARSYLGARVRNSCDLRPGAYPLRTSREFWISQCIGRRRDTYADLSVLARLDGDPHAALAYADSGVALDRPSFGSCFFVLPHQRRGEALLLLGDTAGAVPELAFRAAQGNWRSRTYVDSIGGSLRPRVDSATWADAVARARVAGERCGAENLAKRKAENARLKAAGAPLYYR